MSDSSTMYVFASGSSVGAGRRGRVERERERESERERRVYARMSAAQCRDVYAIRRHK
jgi:hypothetical protein